MAFRLFRGLRVYARMFSDDLQDAARAVCPFSRKLCRADEIFVALLSQYPYLRIASLRAALAYGSFFALWSCLAFRMKQEPFFASDDIIGALGLCGLAGASTVVFISGYIQKYGVRSSPLSGDVLSCCMVVGIFGNEQLLVDDNRHPFD